MRTGKLQQQIQREAYRLVLLQTLGVFLIAILALLFVSLESSKSILAGGFSYIIPSLIFVWRVFKYVGAQQVTQFVTAFFIGEMLKLIMSAILVLVVVKYLPVSLLSVLIGYIGALVSFWVACMIYFSKQNTVNQN